MVNDTQEGGGQHMLGGREIVAFGELSEYGSNRIKAVYPIAGDGGTGWAFDGDTGAINIWGIESERGQRIWEAYDSGELPCGDREKINEVLGGEVRAER